MSHEVSDRHDEAEATTYEEHQAADETRRARGQREQRAYDLYRQEEVDAQEADSSDCAIAPRVRRAHLFDYRHVQLGLYAIK